MVFSFEYPPVSQNGDITTITRFAYRYHGMGDTELVMDMKTIKHQKNEFVMSVGKHEVKVCFPIH